MSYKITCFKCSYCNKIFESQVVANKHEQFCKKNPYAFTCADCLYCKKKKVVSKLGEYERIDKCVKGHKTTIDSFLICQDKKIINV